MIRLGEVMDAERHGGKAAQLGAAIRSGLPVPDGYAVAIDETLALDELELPAEDGSWAVRSSGLDEDGSRASFAGQHLTVLNVKTRNLRTAIARVAASGEDALAYRARLGITGPARVAVVIQRMVRAEVAGVLFTRNPTTHARERVIEASWGLGEAVVMGLVVPDMFRLDESGHVVERRVGNKDVAIVPKEAGDVLRRSESRARELCLDDERLARLHALASRVERVFEGDHDIEWAFDASTLHLLQRRSITR